MKCPFAWSRRFLFRSPKKLSMLRTTMLRSYYLFLLSVFPAVQALIDEHNTVVVNLTGVVNGSVQLHCQSNKNDSVVRIYVQKEDSSGKVIFINGYDHAKNLDHLLLEEYRNRSSVNVQETSMELSQLSLADQGKYKCYVFLLRRNKVFETSEFNLVVTANYSVPTISLFRCSEAGPTDVPLSCMLSCSSSHGYPLHKVRWTVEGGGPGTFLSEASVRNEQDPHSRLWSVSQNATLNCTKPANVSCTIGNGVSSSITLCAVHPHNHMDSIVIFASVLLLLPIIIAIVIYFIVRGWCRRPRQQVQQLELIQPLNAPFAQGQAG